MSVYELNRAEVEEIKKLVSHIVTRYSSPECPKFLSEVTVYAHECPIGMRRAMNRFRLGEIEDPFFVLSGFPVDDVRIGETPRQRGTTLGRRTTRHEEVFLMLCSALVGDAFAWATQQDGNLIHDVLPVEGYEDAQMGSSSRKTLYWHTEDAFHEYRPDYVALMCLRNIDRTPTTVGTFDPCSLSSAEIDILFEPRFEIRPDDSHKPGLRSDTNQTKTHLDRELGKSFHAMVAADVRPQKVPVLHGSKTTPFLCIDPVYMNIPDREDEATRALKKLIGVIDARLRDLILRDGDVVFIDNARAIHGRKPFEPRYDGTDRWLKRINITRDLQKSRRARKSAMDRVIY